MSRGEARTKAQVTVGSPLTDRVAALDGSTLSVLDAFREARHQLVLDVDRCRYVVRAGHACTNRDGSPLREDQTCWLEARAQIREQRPREHPVGCTNCLAPTWNGDAVCDDCRADFDQLAGCASS